MSDFYADRLFNALERNEVAPGMLLVAAPDMASEEFNRHRREITGLVRSQIDER